MRTAWTGIYFKFPSIREFNAGSNICILFTEGNLLCTNLTLNLQVLSGLTAPTGKKALSAFSAR